MICFSRARRSCLMWLMLGLLGLVCIVAYQYSDEMSSYLSYQMRTFPGLQMQSQSKTGQARCFSVEFNQDELSRACLYQTDRRPLCRLKSVSHLNQSEFISATLRVPGNQPIRALVHPPWDLISLSVLKWGRWEAPLMQFMQGALRAAPGAGLLDVGSQLGVYSLLAAGMGRQAVAIDAFYQNSIRLFASVAANGFQDRVRVYWNALSESSNGKMNMFLPNDCNIGGGGPVKAISGKNGSKKIDLIDVRTATLDDIVIGDGCFPGVKELVVKADMEGHEWLVMATGAGVFKKFKVLLIMMEWEGTKLNLPHKAPGIIEFYASRGLLPHSLSGGVLKQLDKEGFKSWPCDVFWATREFASSVPGIGRWWLR